MTQDIALRKLARRITNSIVRGVITLIKDSEGLQLLQLALLGQEDVTENVERLQQYGFTSSPPEGAECLVVCVGGTRSHPVCISAEDRFTRKAAITNVQTVTGLSLQPEDILLYTTHGNFILLRASSGNVIIHSPETLRLDAKHIQIHGELSLKYDAGGHGAYYTPTHVDSYSIGATSSSYNLAPPEVPPAAVQ